MILEITLGLNNMELTEKHIPSKRTSTVPINKQYFILLEDVNKSFNLSMHSFDCFASNMYEAIGKMVTSRVEFKNRNILKITSFDFITKEQVVEYIEKN